MRLSLRPLALSALFVLGLAPPTAGCAVERAPINRVQANALAKSFFVGDLATPTDNPEFYMRTTMVDAAVGAGLGRALHQLRRAARDPCALADHGEGAARAARPTSWSRTPRSQGRARVPKTAGRRGVHHRRALRHPARLQPTTGEENNVIEENDVDRPWYEREYFRVDWSRNLITDAYDLDRSPSSASTTASNGIRWPTTSRSEQPRRARLRRGARLFRHHQQGLRGARRSSTTSGGATTRRAGSSAISPSSTATPARSRCARRSSRSGHTTTSRSSSTARRWTCSATSPGTASATTAATAWPTIAGTASPRAGTSSSAPTPSPSCSSATREETTPIGADPHRDDDQNGTEDECEAWAAARAATTSWASARSLCAIAR
jgi:hypothetical protein